MQPWLVLARVSKLAPPVGRDVGLILLQAFRGKVLVSETRVAVLADVALNPSPQYCIVTNLFAGHADWEDAAQNPDLIERLGQELARGQRSGRAHV